MGHAVAIVSGGLDSVTMAHMLAEKDSLTLVSFNYNQKHKKELEFASRCSKDVGAEWLVVDLNQLGSLLGSALTSDDTEVPEGHYAAENMKQTVVPNRNMIMIAIAAGIAVDRKADYLAVGVHAGDHFIYPDCRPEFIEAMNTALKLGTEGFSSSTFYLDAPFVSLTKDDIVTVGMNLETPVDYTQTWSCYKGGLRHCGVCGTCVERKEAFELSGYEDPTEYDG